MPPSHFHVCVAERLAQITRKTHPKGVKANKLFRSSERLLRPFKIRSTSTHPPRVHVWKHVSEETRAKMLPQWSGNDSASRSENDAVVGEVRGGGGVRISIPWRGSKTSPRLPRNQDFLYFLGRFLTQFSGSESVPVFWVRIRPRNLNLVLLEIAGPDSDPENWDGF